MPNLPGSRELHSRHKRPENLSYSLKVNEFAALTISELVSRYTGEKVQQCVPNNVSSGLKHLRTHGYVSKSLWMLWTEPRREFVTLVKNQGQYASWRAFRPQIPLKVPGLSLPAACHLCASSSSWIVSQSIPVVTVCSWTTACFHQEEDHVHGDHLQLNRSKGYLQSFVLHRGDRTGRSHGMQGRVH